MADSEGFRERLWSFVDHSAADLVHTYFFGGYTGARFNAFAGGGDRPDTVDRFTADDLVAVSLLSVDIPGRAALEILETRTRVLNSLLQQIPYDISLADAEESLIRKESAAWKLWEDLVEIHQVGWVTASKLLARKRPHLLPVYDNVVKDALRPGPEGFWKSLHEELRRDKQALVGRLEMIRSQSGIGDDISLLRVFDVAVWMGHRHAL
jgi:hypothetical protein